MAWISVHEQVLGMKLRELSKAIGCSQKETLGILVSLWLWGINNADQEGELKGADKTDIADALSTGLSTGVSSEKVVECLVNFHWLDVKSGVFYIHDWDVWQEQWYKALARRNYDAERKREERAKKCPLDNPMDSPQENPVQPSPSPSPSPKPLPENESSNDDSLPEGNEQCPHKEIALLYNAVCKSLPRITQMTDTRKDTMRVWWRKGSLTLDTLEQFFKRIEASDFLTNRQGNFKNCSFDWIIKPANRQKILEGNYDNRSKKTGLEDF